MLWPMSDSNVNAIEDAVSFCHVLLLPRNQYLLERIMPQPLVASVVSRWTLSSSPPPLISPISSLMAFVRQAGMPKLNILSLQLYGSSPDQIWSKHSPWNIEDDKSLINRNTEKHTHTNTRIFVYNISFMAFRQMSGVFVYAAHRIILYLIY